jgi:hypothetical protein
VQCLMLMLPTPLEQHKSSSTQFPHQCHHLPTLRRLNPVPARVVVPGPGHEADQPLMPPRAALQAAGAPVAGPAALQLASHPLPPHHHASRPPQASGRHPPPTIPRALLLLLPGCCNSTTHMAAAYLELGGVMAAPTTSTCPQVQGRPPHGPLQLGRGGTAATSWGLSATWPTLQTWLC